MREVDVSTSVTTPSRWGASRTSCWTGYRSSILLRVAALVGMSTAAGCVLLPRPPEARTPLERRGRHVLRIAEGCGCHGANFAGWRQGGPDRAPGSLPYGERFVSDTGTVPAPNITPDPQTGIGAWSDEQILGAVRNGIRPDGSRLSP